MPETTVKTTEQVKGGKLKDDSNRETMEWPTDEITKLVQNQP